MNPYIAAACIVASCCELYRATDLHRGTATLLGLVSLFTAMQASVHTGPENRARENTSPTKAEWRLQKNLKPQLRALTDTPPPPHSILSEAG